MPARRTPTLPTGTLLLGLLTFAPVSAGAGSSLPHSALSGTRGFSTQDQSGIWGVLAATGPSPGTPTGHCAVYDPTDNRMLVYYGSDVWALTLDASPQWTQVQVLNAKPPFRNGACAIMDPVRHRLIVFGGYVGSDYDRSTWILTLDGTPVWSQLPVVPSPGPRLYASAVYDPIRDRMIVFGGESGPSLNDVWALKLSGTPEWSQIFPDGGPPNPRYGHVAIYDPTGDRMVILGGWQGDTPYMDPWALSLGASPAWTSLTPSGPVPPARVYSSAVYDAANSRMVMFAGYGGSAGLSDTWALNFGGSDSFEQLAPLGVAASARWLQTGIYDPVLGRMIIFGGLGGADLRALSWGGAAPVGAPVIQALSPRFGSEGGQVVILGTSLGGGNLGGLQRGSSGDPEQRVLLHPNTGSDWRDLGLCARHHRVRIDRQRRFVLRRVRTRAGGRITRQWKDRRANSSAGPSLHQRQPRRVSGHAVDGVPGRLG